MSNNPSVYFVTVSLFLCYYVAKEKSWGNSCIVQKIFLNL